MTEITKVRPAPYPSDVRAKGWRFELDYEKIERSDAWDLASEVPMAQPALLMMWMVAWTQVPCGSMPSDENLIRLKCRIPAELWPALRPIVMHGWWLADDGRLYHDALIERVLEMVKAKAKERNRKAEYRARDSGKAAASDRVPPLSHGTTKGQTRDFHGSPDTGTRTRTSNTPPYPPHAGDGGGGESAKPTKAESICKAIKARGVIDADPADPLLQAYIDKGVDVGAFEAAALITARNGKDMQYLLGIIRRKVGEASQVAAGPGPQTEAWDAKRSTIEAMGVSLGVGMWSGETDYSPGRETFDAYTQRVRRAVEQREISA